MNLNIDSYLNNLTPNPSTDQFIKSRWIYKDNKVIYTTKYDNLSSKKIESIFKIMQKDLSAYNKSVSPEVKQKLINLKQLIETKHNRYNTKHTGIFGKIYKILSSWFFGDITKIKDDLIRTIDSFHSAEKPTSQSKSSGEKSTKNNSDRDLALPKLPANHPLHAKRSKRELIKTKSDSLKALEKSLPAFIEVTDNAVIHEGNAIAKDSKEEEVVNPSLSRKSTRAILRKFGSVKKLAMASGEKKLSFEQIVFYNHGKISREEAEEVLKAIEEGEAVLRTSYEFNNRMVVSYVKKGKVIHEYLNGRSLADIQNDLGIKKFIEVDLKSSIYNQGFLSRQETEDLLNVEDEGTLLLRNSNNTQFPIISYKIDNQIAHYEITSNKLLRELIENLNASKIIVSRQKEKFKDLQTTLENEALKEPISKQSFDHQVIFDLGNGRTARGLTAKALKKTLSSNTIDLKQNSNDLTKLKQLTEKSRIYFIGHCNKGKKYIVSDDNKKVYVGDYVKQLLDNASQLKQLTSPGNRIKISIVACYGGVDNGDDKRSFAYRLSQALEDEDIHAEVIARNDVVNRAAMTNAYFTKKVRSEHKKDETKSVFISTKNPDGSITTKITPYFYDIG